MKKRLLCVRRWVFVALGWLEVGGTLAVVAFEAGLGEGTSWGEMALTAGDVTVVSTYSLRLLIRVAGSWQVLLVPKTLASAILALVLGSMSLRLASVVAILHDGLSAIQWIRDTRPGQRVLRRVSFRPARSLALSFLGLIAVGTILLSFPAASSGGHVPVLDAFFTAVSATCVTGLITVDTATAWSSFGQGVIFALFQLGGLGIMSITGAMSLAVGRALDAQSRAELGDVWDESDVDELRGLVRAIVLSTLAIEAIGALALWVRFLPDMTWGRALAHAVFHSVSAFCNAGFSLNSNSLVAYAADPWVNGVIILLVTLGGMGFGVLVSLWRRYVSRRSNHLNIHARVVLATSAVLTSAGALLYFFFEFDRSLSHLSMGGKLIAALFQSVTCRTAGFNTVDLSVLHPVSLLVMVALMFIGASPGSTGGGIKTTTLAVTFLAARAFLLERRDVVVFGRRVPEAQVVRGMALSGGALLAVIFGFGTLLVFEDAGFDVLLFESASAVGTAGLSTGITSSLSSAGKIAVCFMMFAGRVGPLTALAALGSRTPVEVAVTYPEGKILVG